MSGPIPEQEKQTEVNKPLKRQEESRSLGWTRGQGVPLLPKTQPGLGGSLAGGLLRCSQPPFPLILLGDVGVKGWRRWGWWGLCGPGCRLRGVTASRGGRRALRAEAASEGCAWGPPPTLGLERVSMRSRGGSRRGRGRKGVPLETAMPAWSPGSGAGTRPGNLPEPRAPPASPGQQRPLPAGRLQPSPLSKVWPLNHTPPPRPQQARGTRPVHAFREVIQYLPCAGHCG